MTDDKAYPEWVREMFDRYDRLGLNGIFFSDIEKFLSALECAMEALEFYGNSNHWTKDEHGNNQYLESSYIQEFCETKAREALAKIKAGKFE